MAAGAGPSSASRCEDTQNEVFQREQLPVRPPRVIRQPHNRCGGYDCEFVEKPPKAVQCDCPVCLLVLCEPHQVTCCGYSFCATCVRRVQEDKKRCPTCNEANYSVFPNKGLKRSLYEFQVYCCQREAGCEWVGELAELERHLNLQPLPEKLLVGCQFSDIDCTYCAQPLQRRYVQAHQLDDCPKRPYMCQYCKKYTATFEEVVQSHWPICPFYPLSCPNNCAIVLQRRELEHHVSQECPLTLVQCDFHVVGCQVQLTRRDMPSHISDNLTGHMSLLQVHMMNHPGESAATYLWLMASSIQKVVVENTSIRSELHEAQEKLRETRDELHESQKTVVQLKATLNLHQETLEKVTYTGTLPFEFTMGEFEQHKRASIGWCSPPFYTHTHGYRMCIKVDANGCELVKGKSISVFGYLMRGDFDDDLYWPFQGAITIQLLNQLEDVNHHTYTISFTELKSPNVINRVRFGEIARGGNGNLSFISHAQLDLDADRKCQFLKDNQLKFRICNAINLDPTAYVRNRCLTLEGFAGAIETQVCVAPIKFTLSDFEQQKERNDVWHSPAFYTHPRGHRMCLQVFPNGYGVGQGTHVTIFICIMQGPFDSGLKWPFQGDITVQMLNQAGDNNHQEKTVHYTDKVPNWAAGRVTNGETGLAWGFPKFIAHSSLGYNAARHTQYLQGDSLKIRISRVKLRN